VNRGKRVGADEVSHRLSARCARERLDRVLRFQENSEQAQLQLAVVQGIIGIGAGHDTRAPDIA